MKENRNEERSTALSVRRRTFLAMVGTSAVAACSSTNRQPSREWSSGRPSPNVWNSNDNDSTMPIETVYRIAKNYHVGPKRKRPPAKRAEGSIWEVTDTNGNG